MSCYIQLGKCGDVLGILPILYHEFQTTGIKPQLVISKDYADILDGCGYVEPVIYDGNFADLKGAIKFAKQRFDEVIVLQTHGNDFPIEHKTASFQLDAWVRAGCVEHFDAWPLVFDERSNLRERVLLRRTVKKNATKKDYDKWEKFILLADHSESSPFAQANELAETLKAKFGATHRIIHLSEIRAVKPFDMLALYDKAACLIVPETMHSHLCKASDVPTIALAADGWRGIAPHKKFLFYCRYADYPKRRVEMVEMINNIVTGTNPSPILPTPTGSVSVVIPIFKPSEVMLNRCLTAVLPQVAEVIVTREQAGVVPQGILTKYANVEQSSANEIKTLQVRETTPDERAILSQMSFDSYANLAAIPSTKRSPAQENELSQLRSRLSQAGQIGAEALRGLSELEIGNAPLGLRQAIASGLAVPKTPSSKTPKVKFVSAGESGIGFGKNVNFGARYATGDFLLILNDDVYLAPDAVEKMLKEMGDGVGLVGHLLRYPTGLIYHAGKHFGGPTFGHVDYKEQTPSIVVPTEMDNMAGASILIRRKVFQDINGYDEGFKFYAEDDDLAMRIRQAGWKLIYTPFATGIHDGHQESRQSPFNLKETMQQSNARFTKKWQHVFDLNKGNEGLLKFK